MQKREDREAIRNYHFSSAAMADLRIIVVLLIVSAAVLVFLSSMAWMRKVYVGAPAIWLAISMVGVAIYNFGYAMELSSHTLPDMMFWIRFQHWGIEAVAPAWLLFSVFLTGRGRLVTPKRLVLLFIIPSLLFIATQTLGGLNLFHNAPFLDMSGSFPSFSYHKGPIALLAVTYYTFCITVSTILFSLMFFRSAPAFRKQGAIYLLGSLIPWAGMILYMFEMTPVNLDLTPFAFSLSGLLFSLGFLRFRLLDIVPLARDVIFDSIRDGVLILDSRDHIIDFNPCLQEMIPSVRKASVGCPVFEVITDQPALLEQIRNNSPGTIDMDVRHHEEEFFYKCRISPLLDWRQETVGKIIMFHDFTQTRYRLEHLEDLAALDHLTGIYNRRYFNELATREIYRFQRYGGELSLITLDLDHFKNINDTYGHAAGDAVLSAAAKILRAALRKTDILGRFGGEEFTILLPGTGSEAAAALAEKLRQELEDQSILYKEHSFIVTASFGVTTLTSSDDILIGDLLDRADKALYEAKGRGRNCVCVFSS